MLHLITSLDTGGTEMMLLKLLSGIDRQRFHNVVVCMLSEGAMAERIRDLDVSVHSLGMQRGRPSPTGIWRLVRVLKQVEPDIMQTWLYHSDLLGLLAARMASTPVVAWNIRASNMDMARYRRLSSWTRRMCATLSSKPRLIIVNSEAGRTFHTEIGYHPREWVVIPNGIDTQQFTPNEAARALVRQELGLQRDVPLIGLVARFDPMKDHHTFLRAAALLSRDEPNTHFVMIGSGVTTNNRELQEAIEGGELQSRMHLLGERADIPHLTSALDVATSSSCSEGFPNVIGEAMACAVPCVVTDVGDSARIVGDTGRVVPPKNPLALAAAWQELLDLGPEERQELGSRARDRIEERYSLDTVVRQYETLYERLAGRSPDITVGSA